MGRKNREKMRLKQLELDNRPPKPYTKSERNSKVLSIMMQLMEMKMEHVLPQDVRAGLNKFIDEGVDYSHSVELPQYRRVLQVNFINDKNLDRINSINLLAMR